jgi:hypothetical protein
VISGQGSIKSEAHSLGNAGDGWKGSPDHHLFIAVQLGQLRALFYRRTQLPAIPDYVESDYLAILFLRDDHELRFHIAQQANLARET